MEITQLNSEDKKTLSQFLRADHLDAERLAGYKEAYHEGALKAIQIENILKQDVAKQLYAFMRSEAKFNRIYGLYPDRNVLEEEWKQAADEERLYTFLRLEGVREGIRSFNPMVYTRFRGMVASNAFVEFFRMFTVDALSQLQSFAGNAYGPRDFLRPHHDVAADRKLAYIFYLNPNWQPSYGGSASSTGEEKRFTLGGWMSGTSVLDEGQ